MFRGREPDWSRVPWDLKRSQTQTPVIASIKTGGHALWLRVRAGYDMDYFIKAVRWAAGN